jgi:hypothetical protein
MVILSYDGEKYKYVVKRWRLRKEIITQKTEKRQSIGLINYFDMLEL